MIGTGICSEQWRSPVRPHSIKSVSGIVSTSIKCSLPIKEFGQDRMIDFLELDFNPAYDGLFGSPILKELNADINFADNTLKVNGLTIPLEYESDADEFTHDLQSYVNTITFKDDLFRLDHLNNEERPLIQDLLSKFNDIFFKEGDNLSFTNQVKHRIITKTEEPVYSKLYRYPYRYKEEIDRQVNELLAQGIIRPSKSPYSAPIWVVPKKIDASGKQKWRLVVDYRKLNEITIPDKFPIPNMDDILDKMGRAMYFTTIDLAKGFHQIEVHPDDIHKTAFTTNSGHYEWTRLPFGLCNAPATFQRLMNYILADYVGKICFVYLDDIIIFSTSLQEHLNSIKLIFERIRTANLKIQLDKCEFFKKETEFLGHVVSANGVRPNAKKIEAVKNFPIPKTPTKIKSFLGLAGFYRKFIKDFAAIAKPMSNCLKKGEKIDVKDKNYINSFNKLKSLLISDPILAYPDFNKEFLLTTDASNYAIGAVLSQNGHPICFASRTLNGAEVKYPTLEKELLAIVWATKYFRPYLYGNKFTIQTDHQPLQWLHNLKDPNNRVLRWKIRLSEYDYKIEYLNGKANVVADALSRIECNQLVDMDSQSGACSDLATQHSAAEDNSRFFPITEKPINIFANQFYFRKGDEESIVIKKVHRRRKVTFTVPLFTKEYFIKIIKSHFPSKGLVAVNFINIADYSLFQMTYLELVSAQVPLKIIKANLILQEVNNIAQLHELILETHQKSNHRGIDAVHATLLNEYYWPNLKLEINKVINKCTVCNVAKYDRRPLKLPFKDTESPTCRSQLYQVDVWQLDTKSYYMTCIDVFSKYAQVYPIVSRTWIDLKNALIRVFNDMGKPKSIKADNDPGFKSKKLDEWLKSENVNFIYTSSKTGIADIERFHGSLNEHIRVLKTRDDVEGLDLVSTALYYYNTTFHSSIENVPQIVHFNHVNISRVLEKKKKNRIYRANKNRKEEPINEEFVVRPRVRKLDNPKRKSKNVRKINDDHYEETYGNNVKNVLYKSNFARKKKH